MASNPQAPPVLFDRALLHARQRRARAQGAVTFLLDRVDEEMADRLAAVMRDFREAADLWTPRVAPFADLRDIGALLQRAGFALPVTDIDRVVVRYDNAFALMHDLRRMGAGNVLIERRRTPTRRATMLRMAEIYTERFADADGRIRATFDLVWLSGWAPHASQQQPLKPGSAKASLADAVRKAAKP